MAAKPPGGRRKAIDALPDAVDYVRADWARERPDLDTSAIGVFARVSRLHARQRALLTGLYEEYDLTLAAFDVLANLRRSGPPHRKTAGELAESSLLTTGGVTFRLDRLEEQDLIKRVRAAGDRRVVYAQLTEHGREVIDAVIDRHAHAEREMLDDLSAAEMDRLARLLKRATASIEMYAQRRADSGSASD
ncbi:MAG: MarR family winged helix-turn-helix transcriptional regulator [Haloechinothrix sp.]